MDRKFLTLFAGALMAMTANAQTQASGQTEAQTNSQTNVSAGGVQASGNAATTTSASAQSSGSSATIANGTEINAALNASVDTKKAKPGDEVVAHTTQAVKSDGKTIVPRGSKLVGHVTRASARGRGDAESALGIAFDKAVLKNGQEIALDGSIQALASADSAASAAGTDVDSMTDVGAAGGGRAMSGGRGALGGVTSTTGGAVGAVTNTTGSATTAAGGAVDATTRTTAGVAGATNSAVGGVTTTGQFASNSRGVFGLNGLNLNAAGSNGTEGSVITSTGKNVHLDSGTRMLIVAGQGAQAGDSSAPASKAKSKPPKPAMHSDAARPNNQ